MPTGDAHKSPLCVSIGEVLWDLLPAGKRLGGAPANVAAHAAQLGLRAAAISAVGDDPDGLEILQRLRSMNVNAQGVRVIPELPTGTVDVKLDQAGVPTFTICAPAAWDAIVVDQMAQGLIKSADAVVFGSLAQRDARSRKAIGQALEACSPGCLRLFDVNLRRPFYSREIVASSLDRANALKLNDEELPLISEMLGLGDSEDQRLYALRDRYRLDLVIYTKGAKGSRIITTTADEQHPGYPASVVDTVGAGDAFTATVIAGWLQGLELKRLQELANRVAAYVCSQAGAVPRLPGSLIGALKNGTSHPECGA